MSCRPTRCAPPTTYRRTSSKPAPRTRRAGGHNSVHQLLADLGALAVTERLGGEGIFVWDGNYYALAVTERLGVGETGSP
jgi:hypothetical protein